MQKVTIHKLAELSGWVSEFLGNLDAKNTATIILLSGDLGAGKTALVKKAAEYFGIHETITSPTFVIQKEYDIKDNKSFNNMIHIDAYRLENKSELEYLGWDSLLRDKETIIFLEWPEMVSGIDIPHSHHLNLSINSDESRTIEVIS